MEGPPKTLIRIGWLTYIPLLLLTLRITWEKTYLTYVYGEQMTGFSLIHGYYAFLILAPVCCLIWMIIFILSLLWKMLQSSLTVREILNDRRYWSLLIVCVVTFGILLIPFDSLVLKLK